MHCARRRDWLLTQKLGQACRGLALWREKADGQARRRPTLHDVEEESTLQWQPRSFMAEMAAAERQACWHDIVSLGEEHDPAPAWKPLRKDKSLRQNPHGKPKKSERTPAPVVHTTCEQAAAKGPWQVAIDDDNDVQLH